MKSYQMFIDGAWCDASDGAVVTSINPTTEAPWATFPKATIEDVDRAVAAAHRAYLSPEWRGMSATARGRLLQRISEVLTEFGDDLAIAETTDTGKLLRETKWQFRNLAEVYAYYAGLADKLEGQIPPMAAGTLPLIVHEPLGVVAAIVPWNSQLHLAAFKIAPALAAGNTIVVKPSDEASSAVLAFGAAMERAGVPKGVFNIVTGGADCGQRLVSHPDVKRISFTGGVETARHIIRASAANIAQMSLELGGKSPVVVYDDADIESALNGVTSAIFAASGQSCAAGSRLLIQKGIRDEFLKRLCERAVEIRMGDPMAEETQMGPLATSRQRERIESLLAQSVEQGARILSGGTRRGFEVGYFFEPTIVDCDHQDLPIMRNELFGPVLSVLTFETEEEAIKLACDSEFAFAGGVFSKDFAKAYRTARAIPAGRFWVNTYRTTSFTMPFGGSGSSGYGREGGIQAIADYTQAKAIFVETSGQPTANPFVMR